MKKIKHKIIWLFLVGLLVGCGQISPKESNILVENSHFVKGENNTAIPHQKREKSIKHSEEFSFENLPPYQGKAYVEVNNNQPFFKKEEETTNSFEVYQEQDNLKRCTVAFACLGVETMPAAKEKRGPIGMVRPSGWHTIKYDCIEGNYLFNRCHLIGWMLGAENANPNNLITGTRYLNLEMLVYETKVAEYIKKTNNHVLYRVTPLFVGEDLVCRGLLMEGKSVEDNGQGISYNVFFYNVQPGIRIDYRTGESSFTGEFLDVKSPAVRENKIQNKDKTPPPKVSPLPRQKAGECYVLNRKSHIFHLETCPEIKKMKDENKEFYEGNKDYLLEIEYRPCQKCHP